MKKRLEYISLRIISLMMSMLLLLSIATPALAADFTASKVQIGADVDNGQTGAASAFTTSLDATGVTVDKYVEKTGDDQFMLTLESFSQGESVVLPKDEPMDIVFVLDQSGSMHAPVGVTDNLYNDKIYYDIPGGMSSTEIDTEKAKYQGYYIAQSHSGRPVRDSAGNVTTVYDWFIVWYVNGYWYYVRNANNYTPVVFNLNYSGDTNIIGATLRRDAPISTFRYYETQFGALHDTMLEFIDDVKETGVNHRIAITGFASPFYDGYENYDGSGVYLDGEYYLYDTDFLQDNIGTAEDRLRPGAELVYDKALVDISTDEGYESIVKSAKAVISNYWHTCPAAGLDMANRIFRETYNQTESLNGAEPERERMVILYTDGYPTTAIGANYVNKGKAEECYLYWEDEDAGIYPGRNNAISKSYETINYYGAEIYTVGTSLMNEEQFLEYVSSNYPDAQSMTNVGQKVENGKYHALYNSAEDLSEVFASIMETSTRTEITLDTEAYTKEFLTDYFDLYGDSVQTSGIQVYTADYMGNGEFAEPELFEQAVISLESSKGDGRTDVIKVSGFDYTVDYIVEPTEDLQAQGKKLVIKVPVKVRKGFWGGNNVPTNKGETAVYSVDAETSAETPVSHYPIPQVNVPRTPLMNTQDRVIYYGSEISSKDLFEGIVIDDVEVIVDEDGTLTPAEDWMDDFTELEWNEDSADFATSVDNKQPNNLTYSVVLTPITDGTANTSEHPSNIAGDVMNTLGVTGSADAEVDVLVPVISYKDSTINVGTVPDSEYFRENNLVDIEWVSATTGEAREASDPLTEPELSFDYKIAGNTGDSDSPYFNYKFDTKLDVTVYSSNIDGKIGEITPVVNFKWNCTEHLHTPSQNIEDHTGSEDSAEFWIHVITGCALPDTVVIDYGLPVEIHLMANDITVSEGNPVLLGINLDGSTEIYYDEIECEYGDVTVLEKSSSVAALVRYTPDTMCMSDSDTFYYVIEYTTNEGRMKYVSSVTVVPATSIYYEDNFLTYKVFNHNTTEEITAENAHYDDLKWSDAGEYIQSVQGEDRPGDYLLAEVDANNIYGYDNAYTNMNQFSMGSSKVVNVGTHSFDDGDVKIYATAGFKFTGTGFDIISLTSQNTGTIIISVNGVSKAGESVVKNYMVDTYYGYMWNGENWVVDTDADSALYQIPVMKVCDLPYGTYDVTITASHAELFDHQQYDGAGKYDIYLDAIRVYAPADSGEDNSVIKDAYIADGEAWPVYEELRNVLIKADSFSGSAEDQVINGAVFIDNTAIDEMTGDHVPSMEDYANYGPNNEVYLAPGQAVAFTLDKENVYRIHIAMKSVESTTAKVKIYEAGINQADAELREINTATDLYYDITDLNGKTVIIYNAGSTESDSTDSVLSVTNIKTTHTSSPETQDQAKGYTMSLATLKTAFYSLRNKAVEPVTTAPFTDAEPTEPAVTTPEGTEPTEVPSTSEETEPSQLIPTQEQESTVPEEVLMGDVNLDGKVNIKDASSIQKYVALIINLPHKGEAVADYDVSGDINIKDATAIQKVLAGLPF